MRLISWNVNGLRSILQKGFLTLLESANADVICLQEIKMKPEQLGDFAWPEGWHMHWNSAQRPGYSGTAILTRKEPVSCVSGIDSAAHDTEGRVLTAEFKDFYLVNVYVPNSQRELTRLSYRTSSWSPAFQNFLTNLRKKKEVVLCGDMNVAHEEIDLARPKENVRNAGFTMEERACFRDLLATGFLDTFREFEKGGGHYTWWSYQSQARARNVGWRIDYFLVTPGLRPKLSNAYIWPHVTGSDHCPLGMDIL